MNHHGSSHHTATSKIVTLILLLFSSGPALQGQELDKSVSEVLLIGTWRGARHLTEYRADHTRVMDGSVVNPPRTWQLQGDRLTEGPGNNFYRVVVLDKTHLVLEGDGGKRYSHERTQEPVPSQTFSSGVNTAHSASDTPNLREPTPGRTSLSEAEKAYTSGFLSAGTGTETAGPTESTIPSTEGGPQTHGPPTVEPASQVPPSNATDQEPAPEGETDHQSVRPWRFALRKGKKVSYEFALPDSWRELEHPIDTSADREFVGPGGVVLSVYTNNTAPLWDHLRSVADLTHSELVGTYGTGTGRTIKLWDITAPPVAKLQLRRVTQVFDPKISLAFSLRTPSGSPDKLKVASMWAVSQAAYSLGVKTSFTDTATHEAFDDPLVLAVAQDAYAKARGRPGAISDIAVTKAQWKMVLAGNSNEWRQGTPYKVKSMQFFLDVMGDPHRTQTVSDTVFWYYECSDGMIQLVWQPQRRDISGLLNVEINDY